MRIRVHAHTRMWIHTRMCIHTHLLIYNFADSNNLHAVNTPIVVNLKLPNAELGRDAWDSLSGARAGQLQHTSGWPTAFEAKAYEVAKKLR